MKKFEVLSNAKTSEIEDQISKYWQENDIFEKKHLTKSQKYSIL